MYLPPHFAETDRAALHRLIRAHPLGMLVRQGEQGLDADHLPFELQAEGTAHGRLLAHVARANPLWQQADGAQVLVVFRGAEGYISPSWYPSKHEAHRQVPTWNYEVVHAHGRLAVRDDERFLRGLLARLTRSHEAAEPRPWKMGEAPAEFIAELLPRIVGIEVTLTALEGKRKLSQNREARDRLNAAEVLAGRGQQPLADAMRAAG